MYNHVGALAGAVAKGAASTGADVKQFQLQETLPRSLVEKLGGDVSINPKHEIITPQALENLDGFIFGAPTRYGRAPGGYILDKANSQPSSRRSSTRPAPSSRAAR